MNKFLLCCLLFLAPVSLASADLKIAVVDLGKAFDAYYKTKEAQARLKEKQDSFQKDFQDLVSEYQHMGEEFNKLKQAASDPTLSQAARDDKTKAAQDKAQDLQNLERKMEETKQERGHELQDEILLRHKEIVDEITKVITDYSAPQGYDLVIDKSSSSPSSGVPFVLYNSGKLIDITADIITKLNATAPAASTAPAPSGAAPAPAAH